MPNPDPLSNLDAQALGIERMPHSTIVTKDTSYDLTMFSHSSFLLEAKLFSARIPGKIASDDEFYELMGQQIGPAASYIPRRSKAQDLIKFSSRNPRQDAKPSLMANLCDISACKVDIDLCDPLNYVDRHGHFRGEPAVFLDTLAVPQARLQPRVHIGGCFNAPMMAPLQGYVSSLLRRETRDMANEPVNPASPADSCSDTVPPTGVDFPNIDYEDIVLSQVAAGTQEQAPNFTTKVIREISVQSA
ncbi:hypothetical protein CLU79DRAFT_835098 [Phycomyces nitens]|nr:hypothetical protein CLU79DRAFT_835098 [Phycomyces nitens]